MIRWWLRSLRTAALGVCLLMARGVEAQQEVVPLGSPLYAELDALFLVAGLPPPSSARPWTKAEFAGALERLEGAQMPAGAEAVLSRLAAAAGAALRLDAGTARFDGRLDLNLEGYAHTNGEDFDTEEDWRYGFVERRPLARLALSGSLGSWFYLTSDLEYAWNFNTDDDVVVNIKDYPGGVAALIPADSMANEDKYGYAKIRIHSQAYTDGFTLNIPPHTYDMECVFPKRAFLSFGGAVGETRWNLSLGRDKLRWGKGRSGSLVLDDSREFDNFVRFSAGGGPFRYELLTTIYDKYDYDGSGVQKSRYFQLHRLEFHPSRGWLRRFSFAVSENIMYQDEFFNIRYLNPAFIYHNWDESELFNALAHAELDFAPAPGWNLYAQYAVDQGRAPNESDSESDAWGLLAGVEHGRVGALCGQSALLTFSLEGAYTSPLLYRRNNVDFLVLNRRVSFNIGSTYTIENIAYPYGGDALVAQFDAAARVGERWEASARVFAMLHGKMNPFVSHNVDGNNNDNANLSGDAPSGSEDEQERTLAFELRGSYNVPLPWNFVSLSAWSQADYVACWNKTTYAADGERVLIVDHRSGLSGDFQLAFGMGLKL